MRFKYINIYIFNENIDGDIIHACIIESNKTNEKIWLIKTLLKLLLLLLLLLYVDIKLSTRLVAYLVLYKYIATKYDIIFTVGGPTMVDFLQINQMNINFIYNKYIL